LKQVHPAYPIPVVTAVQAGYPEKLVEGKKIMLEPRVGIAWQPWDSRTVIRTAYGIYHVQSVPLGNPLGALAGGPFSLNEDFGPNRVINGVQDLSFDNPFPTGPGRVGLQSEPQIQWSIHVPIYSSGT